MRKVLLHYLMGMALLTASCSSSDEENILQSGYGTIDLGVNVNAAFEASTRAVNEEEYRNVNNYTVEILQNGNPKKTFKFSEKPAKVTLPNGTYELKASYGSESKVSRNNFLITGSTPFTLQGKDITVSVDCKPTCGKLVTKFNTTEMDNFFSNYYVEYQTETLKVEGTTAIWKNIDTEPYYVKLNPQGETVTATIHYVRKSDGKEQTQKVSYEKMLPNKKWTLNIKPKNDSGNLSIDITIDETTNDKDITIDIPSEWL